MVELGDDDMEYEATTDDTETIEELLEEDDEDDDEEVEFIGRLERSPYGVASLT